MQSQENLRQRRTAPKEVRRQQLIEATLDVLAEKGVSGTTMASVTGRAGLSLGIVSLHFQSKDNLLTSTLRYLAEEIRDAWVNIHRDASLSAPDRLRGIVAACFDPDICSPTKISVWFAFFGEASYRQVYRDMVEEFDDERTEAIEECCMQIKAEGGYDDVDPEALSVMIECLCDGLWLNMILYPSWLTHEAAKTQIEALLARHFPKHFDLPPDGAGRGL
ncbi:TetR/AcrR family transcriptional regulator [Roseobacter weihaiensis]|uniref:TetR/AcrR family transcriptional regulator n=1 Tax=Roseobacter weihaiensis TaxID=2763262 RepID=UPI001D09CCBB|nr:TetR/AcrR family transcriptional regulator [Roseobacter sp. H9]